MKSSKFKIQSFSLKFKVFINFALLTVIFHFALLTFNSGVKAQASYPVRELGDCRDSKECFLYCEVPTNKPACWSYSKFVMDKQVLGEETSISFPIAELGNCANQSACRAYCEQSENRGACMEFARKKGLGQYKQHQAMIDKAKQSLGCDSMESCQALCGSPENQDKCSRFAEQYAPEEFKQKKEELLKKARETLGCDSFESCKALCENPDNQTKCNIVVNQAEQRIEIKREFSCNSEEECDKACVASPDKCPGYQDGKEKMRQFREESDKRRIEFEEKLRQQQNFPTGIYQEKDFQQ